MAFEGVTEGATKKLGPFPVWVWGVLIGGAFVIWYWVSQRDIGSGSSSAGEDTVGTVAPPSGDFSTVPVIPGEAPIVDQNTNAEWLIQAGTAAGTLGISFVTAQTALMKYLNGQTLTDAERVMIDRIIAKVGPAPEGVASPPDVTPAPSTPTTPTVTQDTKTTVSGATTRRFGQALVIYVKVRWTSQSGHTGNPSGRVSVYIDDVRRALVPLINGDAIYIITPFKSMASAKDGKWVVRARYWPKGQAKGSESNLHVISIR